MKLSELTNDEFISAFQTHHGKQMASLQTCGKFQGSGKYWDEFRRRLTVAAAVDAVVTAADEIMNAVLHVLELQNGEPTKPDGEDASKLYKALAALKAVRDD